MKKLTEMNAKELYKLAQEKEIPNRSKMRKAELIEALKPFFAKVTKEVTKKVSQSVLAKQFAKARKQAKNSREAYQNLNLQFFADKTEVTKEYSQIRNEMKKKRSKKHWNKNDLQLIMEAKKKDSWEKVYKSELYKKHSGEYCSLIEVLNGVDRIIY
ncbi:Rho termination factor N-terminal domain-containing protein [Bacillus haynesii]|uniref:Rho termination factor N-terminal domain-containing protein n=1 Tax=Bacillus haynesii TaxID=1925021 RepID=UPI00227F5FD8|nr:Rho termination factor N-terminal domain-containing protein [Bacillus haynesii]MCY8549329.1 Rho termination factor N-terminal domain-containing protein [Bacillus haynesii]